MMILTRHSETVKGIKHAKTLRAVSHVYEMTEEQFDDVFDYVMEKFGYNNTNWVYSRTDANGHVISKPKPTLEQAKRMEIEAVNVCVDD